MLEGDEWGRTDSGTSIRLSKSVCSTPLSSRVASNELTKISIRSEYVNTPLHPKFGFPHASSASTLSPSISKRCRFRFSAFLHVALVFHASALQGSDIHLRHSRHTKFFPLCPPVFPTHHRPHSASSRCVPLPSNLLLPELFHHHQRVKIRALNPEGTRHHAVRLEPKLPVKLPATWIVDGNI